jgi:hypothetical protein
MGGDGRGWGRNREGQEGDKGGTLRQSTDGRINEDVPGEL